MAGCGDRSAGNTDVDLDGDRGGGAGACYRGIQYGGVADEIFYIDRNRDVRVPVINFGRTDHFNGRTDHDRSLPVETIAFPFFWVVADVIRDALVFRVITDNAVPIIVLP